MSNASCTEIWLSEDITNYPGTCINNPANFNNKIFDCQGHKIEGNLTSDTSGIYLKEKTENTIRNCVITEFNIGIYLSSSQNNTIENNEILNNNLGIFSNSSNSTIKTNFVWENTQFDFYSNNWLSSSGDNNACSKPDGWNDTGKTGCTCIPFDFDSSTDVDIFDVVAGLEHLSEGDEIYNEKCSARSKNKIDFIDLLTLISKIVTDEI